MGSKSYTVPFETWNPLTGCTKISTGCKHCFAERIALRLQGIGAKKYLNGFNLVLHEDVLDKPLATKRPAFIFVNSMSDVFHKDVPEDYIGRIFEVIRRAHWHEFMILTKRAERMAELAPVLEWPKNLWMGVSVENGSYVHRVDLLRTVPAATKVISVEPLVGPIPTMDLRGIDAVFCGGETGKNPRVCEPEWARQVRDHCIRDNVPFTFHGWGGPNTEAKRADRLLDGVRWTQKPAAHYRFQAKQKPQMELFG